MRFLSQAIAQKLFLDSFPQLKPSIELAREIRDIRDEIVKRTDKVLIFLFTTLLIIALVHFDATSEAKFLGITIEKKEPFVFTAFAIGNVLYVVTTGAFLKVFVLEFYLFYIVTHKNFRGSRVTSALLYSYPANIFSALKFNNTLANANWFAKLCFSFTRSYSRYALLVIYSFFYFIVLYDYLRDLWVAAPLSNDPTAYYSFFWILIILNVLSTLTSCAIFLPAKAGAKHAREGRLSEPEKARTTIEPKPIPMDALLSRRNQMARSRQKIRRKKM